MNRVNPIDPDFVAQAQALEDEMIARRRDFHRHPELGFQEVRTAGIVAQELNKLGLEVRTGVGRTGVVGLLEGDRPGPTILLRFDMDALPIIEANTTDYVSQTADRKSTRLNSSHQLISY